MTEMIMALTRDQIFAVAERLDATGVNPTLSKMRKELGSGSFTTLSEAMAEWRARKEVKAAPVVEPIPEPVVTRLSELGTAIWAAASELAEKRLAAEREALKTARSDIEREKQDALELADQVTAELDKLQRHVASLESSAAKKQQDLADLRDQLSLAKERAAIAEARAVESGKRADDLKDELGRVHTQLTLAFSDAKRSPAPGG
jgi:hypothetical protein